MAAHVTDAHVMHADAAMYDLPLDTTTPAEELRDAIAQLIADAEARGAAALADVATERARQDARWPGQDHPDGTGLPYSNGVADAARAQCQRSAAAGKVTWREILQEEVCEAFAETDPDLLRAELIQVAAVAAQWAQAIARRTTPTTEAAS